MADRELTRLQRRFVDAYDGNASQAAAAAGYTKKCAAKAGWRLLHNVRVAAAINARGGKASIGNIASREDRQKFWTEIMLDKYAKTADRLKASELLGRSQGDFLDRMEHSGGVALVEIFAEAVSEPVRAGQAAPA